MQDRSSNEPINAGAGATPLTLPHWFVATCVHRGDDPALWDEHDSATYGELLDRALGIAGWLADRGTPRCEAICLALAPSVDYVALIWGCLLAGAVPAPVNTRLSPVEAQAYVSRLDPSLVIHDATSSELFADGGWRTEVRADCIEFGEVNPQSPRGPGATAHAVAAGFLADLDESDPAIIFPTGGTTGLPKGAFTDHRGLQLWVWNVATVAQRNQRDVELFFSPFFHVSLIVGLFAPLFAGCQVVIESSFDPGRTIDLVERRGITRLMGAPTMFVAIAQHPAAGDGRLARIRRVGFGSTAASPAFVAQLLSDYPNAEIGTGYAATEFASGVTVVDHGDMLAGRIDGVGRPILGCTIRIVDDDLADVAPGEVGEVLARSPWQTRGYWNQPDETASTYLADGFIRLGDLGSFDETGWLTIVGRKKEMIITGGENVYPAEVEKELSALPEIAESVVFGVADEFWGERVEAVVTASPGAVLDGEALRDRVRERLAGYKVPKTIHIVERIPLTPNNKPDRLSLSRAHAAATSPDA